MKIWEWINKRNCTELSLDEIEDMWEACPAMQDENCNSIFADPAVVVIAKQFCQGTELCGDYCEECARAFLEAPYELVTNTTARGKRKDTGEWVFGYYFEESAYEDGGIVSKAFIRQCDVPYEIAPETYGQRVGVFDRKGTAVYTGDVVRSVLNGRRATRVVKFDESCCAFRTFSWSYAGNKMDYIACASINAVETPGFDYIEEVIGNIHDNPELGKDNKTSKCNSKK